MIKKIENPLRFDKVMVDSLVAYCFWPTLYKALYKFSCLLYFMTDSQLQDMQNANYMSTLWRQ